MTDSMKSKPKRNRPTINEVKTLRSALWYLHINFYNSSATQARRAYESAEKVLELYPERK